jgi:hypothetical protein
MVSTLLVTNKDITYDNVQTTKSIWNFQPLYVYPISPPVLYVC